MKYCVRVEEGNISANIPMQLTHLFISNCKKYLGSTGKILDAYEKLCTGGRRKYFCQYSHAHLFISNSIAEAQPGKV